MQVKFKVATKCTADKGDVIEPGEYSGTRHEPASINAPKGRAEPRYILERPRPAFPVDVTALVKSGEIIVY